MQDANLFKNYTMQEVLDDLDVIECFEQKGLQLRASEITKKQSDLFEALGVPPPTSL
jgi:hypothetical protein